MYRQGDVLLEKLNSIPERSTTNETLLVRGEGRNHGHFIKGEAVEILVADENELTDGGGLVTQYLNVESEAALEHLLIDSREWTQEHAPIVIPPGKYRVIKQREYNPYSKAIRAVRD
ncbi:hypothetical protein O3Q51_15125 [Cryomorphaceae bacterium 1068]|nr:hypothetical protein [Cryomorphaceae bacterium 1068]